MTLSKLFLACTTAAILCLSAHQAQAAVITFDDLSGALAKISNGYASLDWNNMYTNDTTSKVSGYANGTVSKKNVAFNGDGTLGSFSSATPFTLNSGYFTAALADGLNVTLTGFLNGDSKYTRNLTLNTNGPTFVTFDWGSVDKVTVLGSDGTDHGYKGYVPGGKQVAMDNLNISTVPLPAALPLFGFAVAGLTAYRRRKAA